MTNNPSERRPVVCPETSTTEGVDLERTPCGVVITHCSRWKANGGVECTRACAARLDQLDQRGVDDAHLRVLVVYSGRYQQTKTIAMALAEHLFRDGLTTELADADTRSLPPPADYEAVVIGSSVHFGRHAGSVIDYIVRFRATLAAMPTFFFSIGDHEDLERMHRATGWQPTLSAVFEHGAPDRRRFLHKLGGRVPSAAELALTESNRIRAFALAIAEEVPELIPPTDPSVIDLASTSSTDDLEV